MELRKSIKKYTVNDFEILDILGIGTHAQVHFVRNITSGKYFAMKIIKKKEVFKYKQVDHILNEINILHMIDHPFIVKIEGLFQDTRYLYIVLHAVMGGELYILLRVIEKCEIYQVK